MHSMSSVLPRPYCFAPEGSGNKTTACQCKLAIWLSCHINTVPVSDYFISALHVLFNKYSYLCFLLGRAFGVLIWEVMSLGSFPYEESADSEIIALICEKQYRLPKPFNCQPDV